MKRRFKVVFVGIMALMVMLGAAGLVEAGAAGRDHVSPRDYGLCNNTYRTCEYKRYITEMAQGLHLELGTFTGATEEMLYDRITICTSCGYKYSEKLCIRGGSR